MDNLDQDLDGLPILKKTNVSSPDIVSNDIDGLPILKKKVGTLDSSPSGLPLQSQGGLPDFKKGEKIANVGFAMPQGDIGRAIEQDKKVDGSTIAGLYNTLVGSVSSLAGGTAYMADVLSAPIGLPLNVRVANAEKDRKTFEDFVNKARSSASSPEFEQQQGKYDISNGLDIQDIKGLAFQAPKTILDMGIGALTAGTSYAAQSINDNQKELEQTGNADKLSDTQKVGYLFTQATIQAALEKIGLDKVLGHTGLTKKVQQKIASEVVDELIQKGVKATARDIENLVLSKATKMASKIKNVGLNAGKSFVAEGSTEGIQQGASDLVKTVTNKIAGSDIFNQEDINNNFWKNILNSSLAGGVMGGVIGGGVGTLNNTNKAIRSQIAKVQSPEDLSNLQTQINEQVELGNITPEEAQAANIKAQQYAEIAAKIPTQVSQDDKYKIIGGIDQRNQLKDAMQKATDEMSNLDESFRKQKEDEIALIQAKLNQVNDYIDGIVAGKEYDYKEKEGEFYKIDPNGKEIPISKEDYDIAKAVQEENQRKESQAAQDLVVPQVTIEEPTQEQVQDDIKNQRLATFTYKSEEEVPDAFKDKISSTGENTLPDGTVEKVIRVTVPQSVADYELSKAQEVAPSEEVKSTEVLEIPNDLQEKGQPIESTLEAERRRSNGERIFAVTEQDESPVEVTSVEMLRNYTPDQLISYKPEVKPTEVNTVEQLRAAEQAEYDSMTDPSDQVKKKEIYDKYDKLITPLLESQKQKGKPTKTKKEGTPTKTKTEVKKTAADIVAEDVLKHLGIAEEDKSKEKPAKKYNKKNVDTIPEEGLTDTQKKVVKDVKKVVKSVAKLVEQTTGKPLEVNIHETPGSYEKAVKEAGGSKQDSDSKGFYLDSNGTIHLNMGKVTTDTMLHEGFHPVLDYMAKNRPDIINDLHAQLAKLPGGKEVIENANKSYKGSSSTTIKKEAITDFIAKVADGSISIDKTNFEKIKAFVINAINKLGFDIGKNIDTITDLKNLAELVSEKFNKGEQIYNGDFKQITKSEAQGDILGAGKISDKNIEDSKVGNTNPLQFSKDKFEEKELSKLPVKSLKDVLADFDNKAVAINTDPTRVGKLTLPSGKEIFMYGGPNYSALKENVDNNIGFASTALGKPKQVRGAINSMHENGKGLVLVTTQKPESMLGNAYALENTLDAITMLPKKILKSSEFRNEFFGKDIVAVKDAFGKQYDEFVKKYGRADFSSPEVLDNMIKDLLNDIGNNFNARNSLVDNLLAGIVEKSKRAATKDEPGYVSVAPNKFISKALFDYQGLNQEKLFYNIGEKGIIDAYMNEGKWGFVTNGFTSDANIDHLSIQDKGIIHPQFNAKFHGENPFILDGAYLIDKLWTPKVMTENAKGEPYINKKTGQPAPFVLKSSQLVSQSMYPKGKVNEPNIKPEVEQGVPQFSKVNQDDQIIEFIDIQRNKGISDEDIKAGLEKVADKIGIDSKKINDLLSKKAENVSEEKAPVEFSVEDAYKQLPRAKNLRESAQKNLISSNFDKIVEQLIKNDKIQKKC